MRISNTFSALKHRNFLYYFIGMCVSTTGTWMQNIAQPWLAYKLTDSAFLLSLVGAMQFLPMLLFHFSRAYWSTDFQRRIFLS